MRTTRIVRPSRGDFVRLPPVRVEAQFVSLAETVDWGLAAYDIPARWKQSRGRGIKVAVMDTGIDAAHPDLVDAIDAARDFTESAAGPADRHGHGTHVAGTIAARDNGSGVIGVAPECRLIVAKVLGDDGAGSARGVAAGIDWACAEGADILSMSFGSPMADAQIKAAVDRAVERGKFVICAAGNDGRGDSVNFPARWPDTIAVAAVDRNSRVAPFSSRGPEVDIAAPGEDVLSSYLHGGYARLSGTSMATPFVSGVVALMLAKHRAEGGATPVRNCTELREHLRRTARDAGPAGHDPNYGWGLIDPARMLERSAAGERPSGEIRIGPLFINGIKGSLVFVAEEARQ